VSAGPIDAIGGAQSRASAATAVYSPLLNTMPRMDWTKGKDCRLQVAPLSVEVSTKDEPTIVLSKPAAINLPFKNATLRISAVAGSVRRYSRRSPMWLRRRSSGRDAVATYDGSPRDRGHTVEGRGRGATVQLVQTDAIR